MARPYPAVILTGPWGGLGFEPCPQCPKPVKISPQKKACADLAIALIRGVSELDKVPATPY